VTKGIVKKDLKKNWSIYLMALPFVLFFLVFCYIPMGGIIMAFQDFSPALGIFHSKWIGLQNFIDFFDSYYAKSIIWNTFIISFSTLIFFFPCPIILALLLNEIKSKMFKKTIQTLCYMPYFISLVVICGLIKSFTDSNGFITSIVTFFGGEKRNLLLDPTLFRSIYIGSHIWQNIGFSSIIYLASLSSVSQEQYEAAAIDGAGRLKRTWHITLPGIAPTIIIMLILNIGGLFNVGYEKIILLYNPITYETADVISTFTYRKGLIDADYGYSTAIGLFNSVINFVMLLSANKICRKLSSTSLF
jgi:putative aldouronate transport system permease protein